MVGWLKISRTCGVPNGVLESVLIAHYGAGSYFLGGRRRRFVSLKQRKIKKVKKVISIPS